MARAVDLAIAAAASRQHGSVTRAQLVDLGLNDKAIAYRRQIGRLHRIHRGVYSVGRPPSTPIERAAAAVLACGQEAVLSHRSALTLWGVWKRWQGPFEVTVAGDRRPRGIRVHRAAGLVRRDATTQLGIRVTSPARTLLDCAPDLSDKLLTRAVNDALLSKYLRVTDLADVLQRFPGHPGAGRLARFVTTPTGPTRSQFEDAFLTFCERFSLPSPQMNVKVGGREVDAWFVGARVVVELDGYEYHADRAAFERDRERDAQALANGLQTVRITWSRLANTPREEATRLLAILRARQRA